MKPIAFPQINLADWRTEFIQTESVPRPDDFSSSALAQRQIPAWYQVSENPGTNPDTFIPLTKNGLNPNRGTDQLQGTTITLSLLKIWMNITKFQITFISVRWRIVVRPQRDWVCLPLYWRIPTAISNQFTIGIIPKTHFFKYWIAQSKLTQNL